MSEPREPVTMGYAIPEAERTRYRNRAAVFTDAIQDLATEVDGDIHEWDCLVNFEQDPDSCNCVLRWWLEQSAAAARAEALAEVRRSVEGLAARTPYGPRRPLLDRAAVLAMLDPK